jgi:hypothetical protein
METNPNPVKNHGQAHLSVIFLFDVLCFPLFDGPIGEFRKSAPDGGRLDFCWLIFEHGYSGEAEVRWLRRDV